MKVKKIFNRNIFKDKSFIKMVCFTVVMLLVLVLGSNFGYVSADTVDYEYTLNTTDYASSSIFNSNLLADSIHFGPRNEYTHSLYEGLSDLDFSNISYSGFNKNNIKYYIITRTPTWSTIYLFDDDVYYVTRPDGYRYAYTLGSCWSAAILHTTNGTNFRDFRVDSEHISLLNPTVSRPDNQYYHNVYSMPNDILYSNSPLYAPTNNWNNDNYNDIFTSFVNNVIMNGGSINDSTFTDFNYILSDGECVAFKGLNNLENVENSSNGGESALNNLYAETADWWLNNDPTSQKFYNGSVTFNSSLNDYIIEHSDEYAINYDFECDIAFYYFFAPPSGQATNWQPTASCPFYKGIYGVDVEDEVEDSAFEWHYFSCHFDFDNDITDDAEDFISDGYGHRFSLYNDLYDNFDATGYLSDNTHITITPAEIIDLINGTFDGGGQLTIKQWSTFRIKCTAKIGAPSYINTSGSISDFISSASSATSGGYSETFDLLTGNSTLGDQSMLTNNNPYTELSDNTYDDTQLPSTGGTSGTTTVSTGNVTQTVNVTNEGAKYIPSLISKLIPTSIGDNTSGITERFYNLAQVNGFVTVMAETVPAVPNVIWTYCEDYLAITLYLLAVAFVLRLILDLL